MTTETKDRPSRASVQEAALATQAGTIVGGEIGMAGGAVAGGVTGWSVGMIGGAMIGFFAGAMFVLAFLKGRD